MYACLCFQCHSTDTAIPKGIKFNEIPTNPSSNNFVFCTILALCEMIHYFFEHKFNIK